MVGKGAGTSAYVGRVQFQMSKNNTAGEGGVIVTNDEGFADLCRSISNCGRSKTGPWYYHERIGTNVRMTEFTANILLAQLSRASQQLLTREVNGTYLTNALKESPGFILNLLATVSPAGHISVVYTNKKKRNWVVPENNL
jgi:dTDP-4-amino-4,6-dideoxygalactose transaminase